MCKKYLVNILRKFKQVRKSCNYKQNINRIYNEHLHYNCLQQLPNLRLKSSDPRKLGNLGERKLHKQTTA